MDKYFIRKLKPLDQWIVVAPSGHVFFEWTFEDAIIRMDIHEGKQDAKRQLNEQYGKFAK